MNTQAESRADAGGINHSECFEMDSDLLFNEAAVSNSLLETTGLSRWCGMEAIKGLNGP